MNNSNHIFDFIALTMKSLGFENYIAKSESFVFDNPILTPKTFTIDCNGDYYFLWHINKPILNFIVKADNEYLEAPKIIIKQPPILIDGIVVTEPYTVQLFMFSGAIDITVWQSSPTFCFYKVTPIK